MSCLYQKNCIWQKKMLNVNELEKWGETIDYQTIHFGGDESLMLRHFQMLLECSGQILIPWYICLPTWMVDFYGKCRLKYTMHGCYGIFHQLPFSWKSRFVPFPDSYSLPLTLWKSHVASMGSYKFKGNTQWFCPHTLRRYPQNSPFHRQNLKDICFINSWWNGLGIFQRYLGGVFETPAKQ